MENISQFICLGVYTAGVEQVFYQFNVSHIETTDQILEAELRLFKLRPAPQVRRALRSQSRTRARHVADVSTTLRHSPYTQAHSIMPYTYTPRNFAQGCKTLGV